MKKSKLLAPAFAFLALSTAAAVTGTVAWFTASRVVTINASAITAYNPEENLKVVLNDATEVGCSVGTSEGKDGIPATVTTFHLRDASVNMLTQKAYGSVLNETGAGIDSFKDVTSNLSAGTYKDTSTNPASTVNIYYAAKYTASFSLYAGSSDKTYDLLFDNSRTTIGSISDTKTQALAAGLRIGVYVNSSSYFVLAPYKTGEDTVDTDLDYVNGTNSTDTATYADANSFYKKDATDNPGETYDLGDLQGSGTNLVTATVWTWFEGTDPAIKNENIDGISSALSVGLSFRIAEQQAAPANP